MKQSIPVSGEGLAMRKVKDFEVSDLGMENSQYFQGYGVAFTRFEYCAYGIGDNPREALDDCLDQIASACDVDTTDLERRIIALYPDFAKPESELPSVSAEYGDDCEDTYYHVGIRWTVE
jgi:hypothetical protein